MDSRRVALPLRLFVVAVIAVAGAACSGSTPAEPNAPAGAPSGDAVVVEGLAFEPETLEVTPGTTVEWTNEDSVQHTVTSGAKGTQGAPGVSKGKPDRPDGLFDGELADGGAMFSFTFEEPGTYEYFCRIHGGMTGVIVVE